MLEANRTNESKCTPHVPSLECIIIATENSQRLNTLNEQRPALKSTVACQAILQFNYQELLQKELAKGKNGRTKEY